MKKSLMLLAIALLSIPAFAQYSQTDKGAKTTVNGIDINVEFFSPKIVRIVKSPANTSFTKNSLSVIMTPEKVSLSRAQSGDEVVLKSTALTVKINSVNGAVSFFDAKGNELLREKEYSTLFRPMRFVAREPDPSQPATAENPRGGFIQTVEETYEISQGFLFEKDEAIYGLGQQQQGFMNQRNQFLHMEQDNRLVAIPYIASTKGYGLFWDNYSISDFTDTESAGTTFKSDAGDCIDYYFLFGENGDGTVAQMRTLTGDAPMMPFWSYGFWQSKERYASQEEIVGVVEKYRSLGVPLDGIIQDWKYWGNPDNDDEWNAVEFANPAFSDPQGMVDKIHKLNAHVIISVWSQFGRGTEIYKQLKDMNALIPMPTWPGASTPYDVFNPAANKLVWDRMNNNLFKYGIDGWWLDGTEPEYHNPRTVAQLNFKTGAGYFRDYRNAFPLGANRGVYTGQRATTSDKRVYILTRSSFAGQQRYAANTWSGDITASYDVMHKQIAGGLNFSICGIPYWNTDIGAFFPPADMPKEYTGRPADWDFYKQLYVRWFQMSSFHPMTRSHGTRGEYEIYKFGDRGHWAFDTVEKFINLRYSILPYIYSTAWQVTKNKYSFLRHPYMDSPKDTKAYNIDDEFLFGYSFLVAPVLENDAKSRTVYLPNSSAWFDFWTNEKFEGGQTVTKETPIDIEPIYIKSGSIVPFMTQKLQYAEEVPWTKLELRVYPGADANFVLYEDEHDSYNYENGAYTEIPMTWDENAKTLTIGAREGSFNGMIKSRKFVVNVIGQKSKTVSYSGKEVTVKF